MFDFVLHLRPGRRRAGPWFLDGCVHRKSRLVWDGGIFVVRNFSYAVKGKYLTRGLDHKR